MTSWAADSLLPGHSCRTIPLPDEPTYAFEPEGSLVATLIRRGEPRHARAVLYVHGWNDYYFQTHMAEVFDGLGYDFHAIDLRRYGRSLRDGQLAGYITDLAHYETELDAALDLILAEGYASVVLAGHSTGGLVASLYAHARPGTFAAVLLNSPWLELQGSPLRRAAVHPMMRTVAAVAPTTVIPLADNGYYLRSISAALDGEWEFDARLKGNKAFHVRVGWLHAIMAGHAAVARGLAIDCPVLVLTSGRSAGSLVGGEWVEEYRTSDAVLDVRRIAERAHDLGPHVTLIRVDGALHDISLSESTVRDHVADLTARFLRAWI